MGIIERIMYNLTDLTEEQYKAIMNVAIDVQYLIVLSGGMATKSKVEDYLMPKFGIDRYSAHSILNAVTEGPRHFYCGSGGVTWDEWNAKRPAPDPKDYPDITGL